LFKILKMNIHVELLCTTCKI